MRYEDASNSFQASGPIANDDSDTLPAGSRQAATGNLITGEGTQYGSAGADSAAGGHVTSIAGKGGEDTSFAGGKLSVAGEHGNLTVDAEGNYSYMADKGAPENVRDRFTYTLADSQGNSDTAALVIELGKTPVVIKADAQQIVPGPDGVVTLPPGVELSDVMVVGRNLVINMPDGTQLIIVDGAVFVPQLVLDGVQVPATNVAALLIGQEPQPAAGELPPSSGGNFALPPPPLDPGVPLGDLLPPTVRDYSPPEPQELFPEEDSEPEVGPNPDVLLDDDALQGGNAGGVGDDADAVNVSGQLSGSGGDGELAFTVQLTGAPAGFTYESGGDGVVLIKQGGVTVLTVTVDSDGSYSVVQNAPIDHSAGGDENNVLFTINYTVTDVDGDSAFGTFNINVDDDTPLLTELVAQGGVTLDETAAGSPAGFPLSSNSALPIIDFNALFGADGAAAVDSTVFGLTLNGSNSGIQTAIGDFPITLVQIDGDTIEGHYNGSNVAFIIQLEADGTITLTQNVPLEHLVDGPPGPAHDDTLDLGGLIAVTVTITDGDGDEASAEVAIGDLLAFKDDGPTLGEGEVTASVDEDELPDGISDGDGEDTTATGTLSGIVADFGADGPGSFGWDASALGGLPNLTSGGAAVSYAIVGNMLVAYTGADANNAANHVFTVELEANGDFEVTLLAQVDHLPNVPANDDDQAMTIDLSGLVKITDSDGDFDHLNEGQFVVEIEDDIPEPLREVNPVTGQVDEDALPDGNNDSADGDDPGGTTDSGGAGSLLGLFNIGADQPGKIVLLTDTSGLPELYSNGVLVTYAVVGDTLTASAGINDVFTLTVNEDGSWDFELLDQLDHQVDDTEDNLLLDFSSIIGAEDADGDTSDPLPEGSFVIDVDDDMPTAFDPDPITTGIENKAGETATADLDTDGNVDDNVGADQPGVIRFANIENGDDSGLESGEEPIEYWLSNDGQTLQGRVGSTNGTDGTLIFQIDLNQDQGPGDDTYTITMFDTIDNGAGVTFDNLTSTKAGNVDVRGVGADDPLTTVDLLLTASANGANATINTDSDSVGAANQSMDAGETVRIDFVTNLEDDPADDLATYPSGFSYDGHVGTQSLLQTIPQVQGSQTETVAFRVFALNTIVTDASSPDDTPDGVDPEFSDSTTVDITHVTVDGWDDGDPLDPGYPAEPAVTVALDPGGAWTEVAYGVWAQLQPDGSVIFTGIQQGDQYGIETGTDFNAVAVTALPSGTGPAGNESTEDSFDLGVFSIGQVDTGEPINLSYDLELTDADGDSVIVTDALQITIAPDAPDMALAATTESADTSSFSLLASDSQEGQVQKTAANSNTLTLATAVAAAGFVEPVAAHDNGNHNGHGQNSELASFAAPELVESYSASDGGDAAVSMLAPDSSTEASASADTSGSNSSDDTSADNSLDDSAAQAAPESNDAPAADDGGSNSSADAVGPVAPTVAMVSAEALEAAANDNGSAQQGGSVEQIVADALDQGGAADMDAVLANLPDGGNGGLQALAHMASPDAAAVSSWHTGGHGAVGAGFDMMFKMDVATHHQDAVQPVANG